MAEQRQGKVTKGLFDAVKLLFENGANNTEVARFMKLAPRTVSLIREAETYEEYKAIQYERDQKYKQASAMKAKEAAKKAENEPKHEPVTQIVEHRQTVTVQATHYMMEEMKKTNEMLTLISNKLAFIVDELCGVKTNAKQDH